MNKILISIIFIIFISTIIIIAKKGRSEPFKEEENTYISMSTTPNRIRNIGRTINSIDTEQVKEIHINIPKKFRGKIEYKEEDTEYLKTINKKIKIFRIGEDLGPISKIIPTLQRVSNNDIVISIDDDIEYPRNLISQLTQEKDKVLCGKGFKFGAYGHTDYDRRMWPTEDKEDTIDVVEGWSGVMYPKRLITNKIINEIIELSKMSQNCKYSDDLIISHVLTKHKVPKKMVEKVVYDLRSLDYGQTDDSLHLISDPNSSTYSNIVQEGYDVDQNFIRYGRCLRDIHNKR